MTSMDVLGDDQVLQANLGQSPFEGIDNDALDFQQLEEFINNVDVNNLFPEEAVGPASYTGTGTGGYGGPARDMQALQQQHSKALQHMHTHPMVHTAAAAAPSALQQQQQQQQQLANSHLQKQHPYCHTQLPDSPPDSGSEPYSPPENNQSEASSCNAKSNMVGGMQMYPNTMPAHTSTSPHHNPHHPGIHGHPSPPHHPGHLGKQPGAPYGGGTYAGGEPPKLNHPPGPPNSAVPMQHTQIPPQMITSPYSSMNPSQNPNKKRKYSESPNNSVTPGLMNAMGQNISNLVNIKQEPECMAGSGMLECDDDFSYDMSQDASMFLDGAYQVIKWQPYQPTKWVELLDAAMKDFPAPSYRVDADKGFNFSVPDDAFVCQKKNHFQVTVHVGVNGEPRYVKTEAGPRKIDAFHIHFKGVKMESTSQSIKIEQSQSDRSKKPFHPVRIEVLPDQVSKVTVGRLHFSETTSNNMRKKGKPNPDQRYFLLVVALHAHSGDENYLVAAHASERIIVRASNPGQFDNDVEVLWQKGHMQDSVYHVGRVGINTDKPDEALTVHGNLRLTGHIMQPSDKRVKKQIEELDPKEQLKKLSQLKVYTYEYDEDFAEHVGLSEEDRKDTGVLAQELLEVLPDAVRETGDIILPNGQRIENFLVVNKDRLYMENVGAVKELCKLTDNLEIRIDELEKMNLKLSKLKRLDSVKSTISLRSISSCSTLSLATIKMTKREKEPEQQQQAQNGTANGAPEAPKPKPHHHHHHSHHHHRPGSKPEETGLCSNRFIQITVTTLVLVMAFCLVSITTLYILEKQKSHNGLVDSIGGTEATRRSTSASMGAGVTSMGVPVGSNATGSTVGPGVSNDTLGGGGGGSVQDWTPEHSSVTSPSSTSTSTSTSTSSSMTLSRQDDPDGGPPAPSSFAPQDTSTYNPRQGRAEVPVPPYIPPGYLRRESTSTESHPTTTKDVHQMGIIFDTYPTDAPSVVILKPPKHVIGKPKGDPTLLFQPNEISKDSPSTAVKALTMIFKALQSSTVKVPSPEPPAFRSSYSRLPWLNYHNDTAGNSVPPDISNYSRTNPAPFYPSTRSPLDRDGGPLITPRCLEKPEECSKICCDLLKPLDDFDDYDYKPSKNIKPTNPDENSSVDTNKTYVYQVPIGSHYSSRDPAYKPAKGSPPNLPLDDYPSVSVLEEPPTKMEVQIDPRARRSVDPEAAPTTRPLLKAKLRIMENNMTITTLYCEDEACQVGLGGNYSYRIPIHPTFPMDFITLDFTVDEGLWVSLCHNKTQICQTMGSSRNAKPPYVPPVPAGDREHFDWSLPVGYYYSSTYYFRVTTQPNAPDVCRVSGQERGHSFAEYVLQFTRMEC